MFLLFKCINPLRTSNLILNVPYNNFLLVLSRRRCGGQLLYSTAAATRRKPPEPEWEQEEEHQQPKQQQHKDQKEYPQQQARRPFSKYLRWTPLPLFAFLAYHQYQRLAKLEPPHSLKNWEISCYRMFPWKTFSRTWGWVNGIDLPTWARTPFLTWYAKTFGCNIYEAEEEDLCQYKNLGEFFRRGLKEGLRPVCPTSSIVSPVDGTVLHFGKIEDGRIEQVKGVTYSLPSFLGPQYWSKVEGEHSNQDTYDTSLLADPKHNSLYTCVIYLAPGDYHRFHSPADWTIQFRRHFAGELLSVNPKMARWISGLFNLNERAVYVGSWKHGFFSMTAVGATNVGSIRVYGDNELTTNCWSVKKNTFRDKEFRQPLRLHKGDGFGEFNLGSTIVLIFEAPSNAHFCLPKNTKVKMGEALFDKIGSKMYQAESLLK